MSKIFKISLVVALVITVVVMLFSRTQNEVVISNIEPQEKTETKEVNIIAFGDSLTAGYGLQINESYPAQLEKKLKERGLAVKVINSGVSGESTKGNLERAKFISEQNPDIVLLGIGGNDALRQLSIEETKKNIEDTILTLKDTAKPPVIVLLQMQAPINAGLKYKQDFDAIYTDLTRKHELVLLPFITLEVFSNPDYKLPDGIHYNQAGYEKIIELYLLEPIIGIIKKINRD